jgi:hypothetical protein
MDTSTPFKWRHCQAEIILLCVRWYLRYPLSSRDLEEMMLERGLHIDHATTDSLSHTALQPRKSTGLLTLDKPQQDDHKGRVLGFGKRVTIAHQVLL